MKLVIVTGLSGSGKSIALNTLEDLGFYCIDNLPLFLLPTLAIELSRQHDDRYQNTAIGIDARNPEKALQSLTALLSPLKSLDIDYEILFLEADDNTLITRYSETRRRHPLSTDNRALADAIQYERELLAPLLTAADLRIDTTRTNVHQLRDLIQARTENRQEGKLSLLFLSFGFKHGVPRDADFVYDVRCLPNPHWDPSLRPLTGRDPAVQQFLDADPKVKRMISDITHYLENWIPCFEADGRSYLTIAVGCTGGQHRSVYMVEKLKQHFHSFERATQARHTELPRSVQSSKPTG